MKPDRGIRKLGFWDQDLRSQSKIVYEWDFLTLNLGETLNFCRKIESLMRKSRFPSRRIINSGGRMPLGFRYRERTLERERTKEREKVREMTDDDLKMGFK